MNGGLGPAACWLAHKRLESWSRIAKERVGAVRKTSEKSEDGESSASTGGGTPPLAIGPLGGGGGSGTPNNSISSSTEVSDFSC